MKMFIPETHLDCDNMHNCTWSRGNKESKCQGTWETACFPFLCTVPWQAGSGVGVGLKGWGSILAQLVTLPHTLPSQQAGGWLNKRKAWLPEFSSLPYPYPISSSSQQRWDNSAPSPTITLHGFLHPVLACKPCIEEPNPLLPSPSSNLAQEKEYTEMDKS